MKKRFLELIKEFKGTKEELRTRRLIPYFCFVKINSLSINTENWQLLNGKKQFI